MIDCPHAARRGARACAADRTVYETPPWCVSTATRCTNAAWDAVAAPSTVASGSACEQQCEDVPACNVYAFSQATGTCALLRSCGTPAQAIDARDYVAFRPGNVERGCTDRTAQNFDGFAVYDDGSCRCVRCAGGTRAGGVVFFFSFVRGSCGRAGTCRWACRRSNDGVMCNRRATTVFDSIALAATSAPRYPVPRHVRRMNPFLDILYPLRLFVLMSQQP